MGFTGLYFLDEVGYRLWRYVPDLIDPLTFTTSSGRRIVMDKMFETDGATVPRFLWSIPGLDPMDWPRGAILHDWLWELRYTGKLATGFIGANRLLYDAIRSLGWPRAIAWSCWLGCTLFGWFWWIKGERGTEE